jgi:predicted tellurium resistance membrane protein TerC
MDWLTNPDIWLSLLTLTALEIVLGIDNLVVIAILADRLPVHQRSIARRVGLALALVTRLGLLFTLTWIIGLTKPIFTAFGHPTSWRDIILIGGGLFLIAKAILELHHFMEQQESEEAGMARGAAAGFAWVVAQIAVFDIVFSLDSVITAVGMASHIEIMVAAIVITVLVMLIAADPVSHFINRNPTVKVLAFAFLLLIGVFLVADGIGQAIAKGYIYFAIVFGCLVEGLNMMARRRRRGAAPKA